jgi:hypothetical protein
VLSENIPGIYGRASSSGTGAVDHYVCGRSSKAHAATVGRNSGLHLQAAASLFTAIGHACKSPGKSFLAPPLQRADKVDLDQCPGRDLIVPWSMDGPGGSSTFSLPTSPRLVAGEATAPKREWPGLRTSNASLCDDDRSVACGAVARVPPDIICA